jgi:uncharacterized protein (TIGR02996 family)
MIDAPTFLAAIRADPADDLTRLAFSDWLRDHPDPGYARAGRFLWAGVVCSRHRGASGPIDDDEYWAAVREMGEVEGWVIPATLRAGGLDVAPDWTFEVVADRITTQYRPGHWAVFERGMVAGLRVPLDEWQRVGPGVVARWPVERVEVTAAGVEELSLALVPATGGGEWELHGRLRVRRGSPAATCVVGLGPDRGRIQEMIRVATVEALRALTGEAVSGPLPGV